jgi:hypothetical protein
MKTTNARLHESHLKKKAECRKMVLLSERTWANWDGDVGYQPLVRVLVGKGSESDRDSI